MVMLVIKPDQSYQTIAHILVRKYLDCVRVHLHAKAKAQKIIFFSKFTFQKIYIIY